MTILSIIIIYVVGFMVSVFLWTLFTDDDNEATASLSIFWPLAIPTVLIFLVGCALYYGPEWLAIKCREAIAKWGE
jgi:amino acid transporter